MVNEKTYNNFFKRLKHKYRLTVFNDHSYEELVSFRFTKLNVFSVIGFSAIILIALVTFLIAFTPIREFIPGYPDGSLRRDLIMNAILLDSLENEIRIREQFLENIRDIISGREPRTFKYTPDTVTGPDGINFARSRQDSLLRTQIEREEQFNFSASPTMMILSNPPSVHFSPPTNGLIINRFNPAQNHFGVDMVTEPDQPVVAISNGTVTFANWTVDTGYVIQIQHDNNFLSLYKHNAELLKSVGDFVTTGEAIAIVGNSGELTTGPHLHFELWQNGSPLNPEAYILF
jgi:murein DD-endopeptidase MepM/ murein hydrolase activator NlpD